MRINGREAILKSNNLKNIFISHIKSNIKEYIIAIMLFVIGIMLGVIFINNANVSQVQEITTYIDDFLKAIKDNISIDKVALLKNSLISNLILVIFFWFMGSTVIGIPIVYGMLMYRGFCLGYTISSIIASLGFQSGLVFTLSSIFFQNILFIPSILALAVSGMKLHKSIMKDKRKENIKIEITRHTIFCTIILIFMMISAMLEVYISTNLLSVTSKYI